MKINKDEQKIEKQRLTATIELVKRQLEKAKNRNDEIKADVIAARKEMRENSDHAIGNLWGSEAFEALAELSQFTNEINDKIIDSEETQVKIGRLQNMITAPYFARIDFKFGGEDEVEKIYIGKTALKSDRGYERFVYDWRSPIAGVFYRFMPGKAFYEAPAGRIDGTVGLKRQYEIKDGELEYFFDADVQVVDEFLRKALSQNTSPQMKTIVETIQKEQDIVIRDMENELMMVQGVAGSGKTSIALHRAAYLMYQGLSESLTAEDILIISPNSLFEQYIANVLPELGEENVSSAIWEEIAMMVIGKRKLQVREQFLEKIIINNNHSETIRSSMVFKSSPEFIVVLDRLIADLLNNQIKFEDIFNNGSCIIKKEVLKEKLLEEVNIPIKRRLKIIEEYILDVISDMNNGRVHSDKRNMVKEYMTKCATINIKELYQKLFEDEKYFEQITSGIKMPSNIKRIIKRTRESLMLRQIQYDDTAALVYLSIKINGEKTYQDIKQVVIDEAQDYYPLHFENFKLLFPTAKLTVLGDVNQTLEKIEDMSLYENIRKTFNKKMANLVVMDKSFRCTSEILKFSSKFLNHHIKVESFNRKGEQPQILRFKSKELYKKAIINKINECQACGYRSVGLICKTKSNVSKAYEMLKNEIAIQMISDGNEVTQGTFVIPVYMSKGLEFDAVLICDADSETYYREIDKNLLYVATTRALHQLDLFCVGEPSCFL